jgi:O-antigen/teichoic acid export membrane protein
VEEKHDNAYRHVLKYTGIFGGVQGLNIVIGLVRNKIVASLLGPAGMGLSALFTSVVNFVSQATNLGIPFSAVRHVSELFDQGDEERIAHFVKVVRAWSLLTALLGMLVCMLAGPLLSSYTFSWGDHTLHFVLLAPAVGLMAITGGETAILKGARRLKSLAMIQLYSVFLALVIAVPVYFFFREAGIVPVIVMMAVVSMLLTVGYSYRLYPLRLKGGRGILGEGMEMVRLGVAFVLAGIIGSGAEMLIRSFLNVSGDLDMVGFYNAGFLLTVTYAGMVFSAMETDYFPRLSGVAGDRVKMSETVNRQIEVSTLLVSPMLAVLILLLPVLVPLLFRSDFSPMTPMAQVMVFSMYLRAVTLPISYMVLAKGDSLAFLILEGFYSLLMVGLVVVGYRHWGLIGTGIALDVSYVVDLAIVYLYTHWRYGYRTTLAVVQIVSIQLPLGLMVYILTLQPSRLLYWTLGSLLCFVSIVVSMYILHQKSSLWNALAARFKARFKSHD